MGHYSGIAQGFVRYREKNKIALTQKGQDELHAMLTIGCQMREMADFFCIEEHELAELCEKGGQCHEIFRNGTARYRRTLREHQLKLSGENASMAKRLGELDLQQPKEPPREGNENDKKVIGTMPEWEGDEAESWLSRHRPAGKDTGSTIEKLRRMNGVENAEEKAGDAEVSEK